MTPSDNTIRCGLTTKYIDLQSMTELCSDQTTQENSLPILRGSKIGNSDSFDRTYFELPETHFDVSLINSNNADTSLFLPHGGMMFIYEGQVNIHHSHGSEQKEIKQGAGAMLARNHSYILKENFKAVLVELKI